jgi:hypothetical protein
MAETTQKIIWQPQAGAQVKAMTAPNSLFEILIHGNRGGGKTDVLLMMFAQHVGRGWGASWKGIIFRETFPNLQDIISKSQKWFYQIFPDAVYNKSDHAWHFKTGEILYFRHARTVDDYWSYHGHEYPFVGWEELTNWATSDLYMMMMSVCRSPDKRVIRRYVSTCNPWGCVPYGNVVTRKGLTPIQCVEVGDYVLSWENGDTAYKRVTDTISYEYSGDIINYNGMEFTDDHRLPMQTADGFELKQYKDLPETCTISNFDILLSKKNINFELDKRKSITNNVENRKVYCLTVEDTGCFFIDQKGKFWLSGNSGHNWVKSRFIDAAPAGKIIKEVIKKEDLIELGVPATEDMVTKRTHIKSDRKENKALMEADPTYALKIAQNGNEAIRKAWLDGDWDILAGGMFDDLWNPRVHVIKPFAIPRSWKVYRTFDWGLSAPFALMWFAVSDGTMVITNEGERKIYPRGTAIAIGEWYGCTGKPNEGLKLTNIQLGRGIKEREEKLKKLYDIDKIYKGPADASIFGSESDGEDIAGKISKAYYNNESTSASIFLPSNKAPGTRVTGWQLLRDKLEASNNDDKETPHIYFFDTCRDWIRTIRLLPRDEKNPDDVDTEAEDHLADAVRYFCLFIITRSQMQRYNLH